MKNFKRGLSVLLLSVLIVSAAACHNVDKNYGVKPENSSSTQIKSNFDDGTKIMSSDRVMSTYFDISLFDEENYSDIYLGKKFTIEAFLDGHKLDLPTRTGKIAEDGWYLSKGNEYNENSLVFSYETVEAVFENSDGVKISAKFYNSSRSSVKLSECDIVKFKIVNEFTPKENKYIKFNVSGITNEMAVTDVIDTLGVPSHFYEVSEDNYYLDYFLTKKDRRNRITVYINPVDDCIRQVEFSHY